MGDMSVKYEQFKSKIELLNRVLDKIGLSIDIITELYTPRDERTNVCLGFIAAVKGSNAEYSKEMNDVCSYYGDEVKNVINALVTDIENERMIEKVVLNGLMWYLRRNYDTNEAKQLISDVEVLYRLANSDFESIPVEITDDKILLDIPVIGTREYDISETFQNIINQLANELSNRILTITEEIVNRIQSLKSQSK